MAENKPANYWEAYKILEKKLIVKRFSRIPFLNFCKEYTQVNAYNLALFATVAYVTPSKIYKYFTSLNGKKREFDIGKDGIKPTPFLECVGEKDGYIIDLDQNIHSVDKTDTQFYFAKNAKQILIAIRGTTSRKDWWQNIQATQVDFIEGKGQVHQGFYDCFLSIKDLVTDYLDINLESNSQVIITGHSLGGAVATLTAAYIRSNYTTNVMLYTFGSPRVGTKSFVKNYSSAEYFIYHRIVNNNDIVPLVPMPGLDLKPWLLPLGFANKSLIPIVFKDLDDDTYTHLGHYHHIVKTSENNGILEEETKDIIHVEVDTSPIDEQKITLDSLLNAGNGIEDHDMKNYISFLESDYRKGIKKYLSKDNDDISSTENDIQILQAEIDNIEKGKNNCLQQAQAHDNLAKENKEDTSLASFHSNEAGKLHYKVACFNLEIARRNVTLSNYKNYVEYQRKNPDNKSVIIKQLLNLKSNSKIERELQYHASL